MISFVIDLSGVKVILGRIQSIDFVIYFKVLLLYLLNKLLLVSIFSLRNNFNSLIVAKGRLLIFLIINFT